MTDARDVAGELAATNDASGTQAMFDALAAILVDERRWHALFDVRLLQARDALGLPLTGDCGPLEPAVRERLDAASVQACREVGWPLLHEGQVSAGWMYLRAAAEPADVARSLAARAARLLSEAAAAPSGPDTPGAATDATADAGDDAGSPAAHRALDEIVHIALWEGVDPALGLSILLERAGTCNAITAYEQGVSRLPAARQRPAADLLVDHLHGEVYAAVAADLVGRGIVIGAPPAGPGSITALLDAAVQADAAAGGLADDPAIHCDVSHLQSVLRIARVCTDRESIHRAWELACYGCRLPAEVVYPGEAPFENVAEASRLFFGAQLGHDVERAVRHFRTAAATARIEEAGTLPADVLTRLLSRLGRPREALQAAVERPRDDAMPSPMQAGGMLPSLVDLAAAGDAWDVLRQACIARGDWVTFAAALAAERRQGGLGGDVDHRGGPAAENSL